ncbi:MAG: hypothetical protein ACRC1K_18440 [Planctomycetia bacterium]
MVEVLVGPRTGDLAESLLESVRRRLGGRPPALLSSDEWPAYADAVLTVFGETETPPPTGRPGRPKGPRTRPPAGMCYATVNKTREKDRIVAVERRVLFGTPPAGAKAGTSYLERWNATDRHRTARKGRKTYRFSKEWAEHEAATEFGQFSYNFCWPVRTLAAKEASGRTRKRTPAMAAGLTDHVWTLAEWLTLPAVQR